MKDLMKIYRRYILTAASISILIIILNVSLYMIFMIRQFSYVRDEDYQSRKVSALSAALASENGSYTLSENASEIIDSDYAFAMLIGQDGQVVWSQNLPNEIPLSYSLSDVASFSRWYLEDYAVKVWEHPDGLFVVGSPKGAIWKHGIEYKMNTIHALPMYLFTVLGFNLLVIFLLALLFGWRFYSSLKPLANGIEHLTDEEPLSLSEQGLVGGLARKLNKASELLHKQQKILEKRDHARTNWIAGVSHDIRTPLSLIMGYAVHLEESPRLLPEEKKEAVSIRENSLHIKKLVEDLNLTSKLEYDSYPLRLQNYAPAALLRSLAASYLNGSISATYNLEIDLDASLEAVTLTGDTALLQRAFRNLLDNSIRHNPKGCNIWLRAALNNDQVQITFSDDGKGIPASILNVLHHLDTVSADPNAPHVMGLRIVHQIIEAHRGKLEFEQHEDVCRTIKVCLSM